jgi:hypothetical protein
MHRRKHSLCTAGAAILALSALACLPARAAVMTAQFSQTAGQWEVALNIINDGTPPSIANFTVFFDGPSFSSLTTLASPAGWDSIVVQADPGLASPGFFDSAASATEVLGAGQSQSGFVVGFAYTGVGAPSSLRYQIHDESFTVLLFEGQTVPVPEPAAWLLGLAGLGIVARRASHLKERT